MVACYFILSLYLHINDSDLRTKLTFFHRLLDTRANTYTRLLKLNGRLALFMELTSSTELDHNAVPMEIEGMEEDS